MSTLTQITDAMLTLVNSLSDVDQASRDGYLPPVTTQKVAAVMPPMGLSGEVGAPVGTKTRLVHRIPCEFWVRVHNGDLVASLRRGREICLDAAAELQASLTLGGTVTFLGDGGETVFAWRVDDEMIEVGKGTYIRAILTTTVTEWVTLQP